MKTVVKHLHYPINLPRLNTLKAGVSVNCDLCNKHGTVRIDPNSVIWVDWEDGKHTVLTEELCNEV